MNKENLPKFMAAVANDPDLQKKVSSIPSGSREEQANRLAALSAEADLPVSADVFLAAWDEELSAEDLERVSGGVGIWDPDMEDIYRTPAEPLPPLPSWDEFWTRLRDGKL